MAAEGKNRISLYTKYRYEGAIGLIEVSAKGDFSRTLNFLRKPKQIDMRTLKKFGEEGVQALKEATPFRTGKTANSWYYEIIKENDSTITLRWCNSNIAKYVPVVLLLQYGHATVSGGWVEGQDFINPAMEPIFNKIERHIGRRLISDG